MRFALYALLVSTVASQDLFLQQEHRILAEADVTTTAATTAATSSITSTFADTTAPATTTSPATIATSSKNTAHKKTYNKRGGRKGKNARGKKNQAKDDSTKVSGNSKKDDWVSKMKNRYSNFMNTIFNKNENIGDDTVSAEDQAKIVNVGKNKDRK